MRARWTNKTSFIGIPSTTIWHPSTDKSAVEGGCGIQVGDCETLMQSKNEERCFVRTSPYPSSWLTNCGLSYRTRNSFVLLRTHLQLCLALVLSPAPYAKEPRRSLTHL